MNSIDLTTILGNISLSLVSVRSLALALGYLLGIVFVVIGLMKFTKLRKHSEELPSTAFVYVFSGAVLLYLPSSFAVLSNTFFGSTSILQYTPQKTFTVYDSMRIILQTIGVIWFVRGVVVLVQASQPGKQEGVKGLFFVIGGILAVNFDFTVEAFNGMVSYFISMMSKIP